jgi:1-acyl-sn-glycerol-3-phosphate acyltransferase
MTLFSLFLFALFLLWFDGRCREASRIDWGSVWLNRLDGLNRIFCRYYHRLEPVELPLPECGGAIVVANHVSGLDPLLMIASSHRPLRFLIAREQYQRFGVQWLFRAVGCIPVDREKSPEKAMRQAFKALLQGEVVALFPHGKIHLDSDPPRKIKAGAARLASRTSAPVIPLRISGVRAQGRIMRAIVVRSEITVQLRNLIQPGDHNADELNELIQQALEEQTDVTSMVG